ncbi:prostate stem cell antigen-like isoform X2 [Chiloscyllium punctatum]|uniref:prostate stem cell antigen-like isoform X2 n=1 Tax=Chiloscyllium punctatum TaxID=137246 RepID=UPI003B641F09
MHLQPALVLVLCAFLGYGEMLKCYKCSGSKCNSTQMGVEDCGVGQVCMTMSTWQFQDGVLLKHSCVPSKDCVNISLNLGTIRKVISCCNHDLCNTNPARKAVRCVLVVWKCRTILSAPRKGGYAVRGRRPSVEDFNITSRTPVAI